MHKLFDRLSKRELLDEVTKATKKFKDIYESGVLVPIEDKSDIIKKALEDAKINTAIVKAIVSVYKTCKGEESTVPVGDLNKQRLTFVQCAAVVPLRNRNDHNYDIGEPVLMMVGTEGTDSGMRGLKLDGSIGALLPRYRRSLRPADTFEIEKIVNKLYYSV